MKGVIFLVVSSCAFVSLAQDKKIIPSESFVLFATIDRAGDLYAVKDNGNIDKYNNTGGLINTFHNSEPPTLFDTGNGVRLLAYYRNSQEVFILNPSMVLVGQDSIDPSFAIDPWIVCSSGDYDLWILDGEDWSLKKIDTRREVVLAESLIDTATLLKGRPAFTYMREYQHFLFLLEKNTGIMIFNNLGTYLRTIPAENIECFNFLGEELYFVQDKKLTFIDLFTLDKRENDLSEPPFCTLITDDKIFKVGHNSIVIEEFKP